MRISDWSSDVCSSDLPELPADPQRPVQAAGKGRADGAVLAGITVAPAKAGAAGFMELAVMRQAYIYIMTNKLMGILYIGVTDNLPARIFAHRSGMGSEFCRKWNLTRWSMPNHSIGLMKRSSGKRL